MQWKIPKNTDKYQWTLHVTEKMRYYGLSEQKVLGVIRRPQRIETGIAEDTVAVMLPVGNIRKGIAKPKWGQPVFTKTFSNSESSEDNPEENTWNQEIWVMYQLRGSEEISKYQFPISKQFQNSKIQKPQTADEKALKLKKLRTVLNSRKKLVIISAWRYPGVSPKNNPIPAEILREIEELGLK